MDSEKIIRAKRLLTGYLNAVGQEETETVSIDGEPKTITKAEALARRLWLMALGGTEEFTDDGGQVERRVYKPDRKSAELIIAYLEGKPPVNKPGKSSEKQKPYGFTSNTRKRLSETLESTDNKEPVDDESESDEKM